MGPSPILDILPASGNWGRACVYTCGGKSLPLVSFLRCQSTTLYLETWSVQLASEPWEPVSVTLSLGLQVPAATPSILRGFWGLQLNPHACVASTLLTDCLPSPLFPLPINIPRRTRTSIARGFGDGRGLRTGLHCGAVSGQAGYQSSGSVHMRRAVQGETRRGREGDWADLTLHVLPAALSTCGISSARHGECPGEEQRREYPFPLSCE